MDFYQVRREIADMFVIAGIHTDKCELCRIGAECSELRTICAEIDGNVVPITVYTEIDR